MVTQAPTLDEVVAQQPGVIKDGDKLHFRGGRSDENLFVIDGVKVKDLLSGQSSGNEVSARSAQKVDIVTGGFGAEFSQAMSGVVNTKLKEGTSLWHGAASYDSDMLTDTQSLHHIYAEISGPNKPLENLLRLLGRNKPKITFFSSLSSDLSDGYLPGIRDLRGDHRLRSAMEDNFLGRSYTYGTFFTPRSSNHWRAIFKSAWKIDKNNKLAYFFFKISSFISAGSRFAPSRNVSPDALARMLIKKSLAASGSAFDISRTTHPMALRIKNSFSPSIPLAIR